MKRVFGGLLLLVAVVGLISWVAKVSAPETRSVTASTAYEHGRQVGKYMAGVVLLVLGALGAYWLLQSDEMRPDRAVRRAPPAGTSQTRSAPGVPTPWFRTTPAIIGLSVLGTLVGLVLLASVVVLIRGAAHRRAISHSGAGMPRPPSRMQGPQQTGPFALGAAINAQWAGGWLPGKIVSINPGGFSAMVQLEDRRFPQPIVLSTNQLRLR